MSELPQGVDPDVFEEIHIALAGIGLTHVLKRPAELWEMLQLVKSDRSMVRGEIYRYDGLREAYRAVGIARTIVQKLDLIRSRTQETIQGLRAFMAGLPGLPADPETREFCIAFITISPKGREAVAKWVADPAGSVADATTKIKAVSGIIAGYMSALRSWKPAPPPPSSPLDKENRPQLTPRFLRIDPPLEGPLIPLCAPHEETPAASPAPASAPAPPAEPPPSVAPAPAPEASPAPARDTQTASPISMILPRGVNPEILEDVRRVEQCRRIFEETHQEIEVWEVFCLVMLDSEGTRTLMEQTLHHKEKGDMAGFTEGALQLFDRLLKIRAQHGRLVRDLRGFLAALQIGSFGRDIMEMAMGFIVASSRGRDRAQLWLAEPSRYRSEACGRLEDLVSRTMNYQTALRMIS
jgi:hypothetical protein